MEAQFWDGKKIPTISFKADGEDLTQTTNLGNSQSGKTKDGSNWWIWLLVGLAAVASLFFLFRFTQRNSLMAQKSPKPKATDAKGNALKSLRQLDDISGDLLNQVEQLAIQFFKELTQNPHFLVSEEAIREFTDKRGISDEIADEWREFWREIQSMKYANFGQISTVNLKDRLKELIEKT
jgi:hypothetical protein